MWEEITLQGLHFVGGAAVFIEKDDGILVGILSSRHYVIGLIEMLSFNAAFFLLAAAELAPCAISKYYYFIILFEYLNIIRKNTISFLFQTLPLSVLTSFSTLLQ